MNVAPRIDVVGLVVADMAASIGFYRRLGFAFADGAESEGHVETALPGGLRLVLDTIDIVRSFDPGWTAPSGGHRIALAFACDNPAEVDALFAELVAAGHEGHLKPWDAFWGQRYATSTTPTATRSSSSRISAPSRSGAVHPSGDQPMQQLLGNVNADRRMHRYLVRARTVPFVHEHRDGGDLPFASGESDKGIGEERAIEVGVGLVVAVASRLSDGSGNRAFGSEHGGVADGVPSGSNLAWAVCFAKHELDGSVAGDPQLDGLAFEQRKDGLAFDRFVRTPRRSRKGEGELESSIDVLCRHGTGRR